MDGFAKRTRAKKEAALDAALALFAANGIKQTGIAAVAERARISQVTLYKYFGSKHNLARCAVERYYDRLLDDFTQVVDSRLPFEKKIEQAFFAPLHNEASNNPAFWEELLCDEFVELVFTYEQKMTPVLLRFIEEGRRIGRIGKGYSNETMLFYIRVFSAQAVQSFSGAGNDKDWRQKSHEMINLFLYGLSGNKEESDD